MTRSEVDPKGPRPQRRVGWGRATWAVLALMTAGFANAQAPQQVTGPGGDTPKPPAGSGVIRGQILLGGNPARISELPVALYALRSDGAPGLMGTRTDADGRFVFEGISDADDIVYLVGAEYLGVPFAQRAVFEAGARELVVDLALNKIVESRADLGVPEVTYKFDWVGGQLFVQISHRILNPSDEVVYVAQDRRGEQSPPFTAALPENVSEYIDGQGGQRSDLVRDGNRLHFWGPVYPGPQDLRYGYLLDGPQTDNASSAETFEIVDALPVGADRLRVLVAAGTAAPHGNGLADPAELVAIEDVEYASYVGAAIEPGGEVRLSLPVPASSHDLANLELTRADFWIDHDDTAIRISAEVHVSVAGPNRLLAPLGGQLLDLELPPNAQFLGLSGSTRMLGVEPNGRGGLAVRGPLAPGPSVIAYRYRIPVDGRAELDIRFERAVDLLNILVADNGVIIESERLHRKRPFKQGTRFYLHREAYQIDADEVVSVALEPLRHHAVSPAGARWAALGLAALAAVFLVRPLRDKNDTRTPTASSGLALEREILYESIHDLDHDFETGKIDAVDFRALRDELRADAIALMRQERATVPDRRLAPQGPLAAVPGPNVCPTCGAAIEISWSFCAGCGGGLDPKQESA